MLCTHTLRLMQPAHVVALASRCACPRFAGTPSAATAWYYNIYRVGDGTPVNTSPLLADSNTATGATVPTTPSGGTDYKGLTASDRLSFNTGNLATKEGLILAPGVYQVSPQALSV